MNAKMLCTERRKLFNAFNELRPRHSELRLLELSHDVILNNEVRSGVISHADRLRYSAVFRKKVDVTAIVKIDDCAEFPCKAVIPCRRIV